MTTQNSLSLLTAWRRSSGLARGLAIAALAASGWALSAGAFTLRECYCALMCFPRTFPFLSPALM